jgi:hypothetical protein
MHLHTKHAAVHRSGEYRTVNEDGAVIMEKSITQSKAQLAAQQAQTDLIASLTAERDAAVAGQATAEAIVASMPAPIADEDKLGWYRIHMDWAGSPSAPTPREDVAILLVPNMSFQDNTKPLSGLLADFTQVTNTTPLTLEQGREELLSGLTMRIDKAKNLATGEQDPDTYEAHSPDFRNKSGDGGGFKSVGKISLAS